MLPGPGELVGGKYRIVRLIGEGGMGSVFEAHHEHLGSQVALKFLHPDLALRPTLVARFLQEARVSAAIKSPHVTQVTDVDQTPDGHAYLVMELLVGESLGERLERQAPLPVPEAVDIGLQILAALEAAHALGVVHRDLKPENVWLVPSPTGPHVKLLDFGIAKLKSTTEFHEVMTRPGAVMGTPAYMAPEQAISADQVDARADLYSFGVILYEMLSGARPVDAEDPHEILARLIRGDVRPLARCSPETPPDLARLVDRLVAPNPDARPATAALVRTELSRHARASARPPTGAAFLSTPVAATLPPDDDAPPHVTREQPSVGIPRVRTDSMLAAPEERVRLPSAASAPPVRSRRGALWVLIALVLGLGVAGAVAVLLQARNSDPLPPLPGPLPSAPARVRDLDAGLARARVPHVHPAPPRPALAPVAAPTEAPGTPGTSPTPLPLPTFPGFTIPPSLLPLASALPPFFPQFQGAPAAPSPSPSAPAPPATPGTAAPPAAAPAH